MESETIVVLLAGLEADTEASLQTALADHPVTILTAAGIEQAVAIIGAQDVHIVVLDQRQSESVTLDHLQQLKQINPELEGFLLTTDCQYEPEGQVAAGGLVHHYIQFPSDNQILGYRMRQALRVARLKQELSDLRCDLHHDLDTQRSTFARQQKRLVSRVQMSEAQAKQSRKQLQQANEQLSGGYRQMVRMLSNLSLRRMGQKASGQNQHLNQLVALMAENCALDEADHKHLTMAWMLRNVGKLSFNDYLLATPYVQLTAEEQREYQGHPDNAYAAMAIVRPMDRAATIVRQHKEYLDGSGYPLGLKALQIELAAQILAVLNDYTELTGGRYLERQTSTAEALDYLRNKAGERYNQQAVDALEKALTELAPVTELYQDRIVTSVDLQPGMVLTRDLISQDGVLLLGHGEELDQETIDRIRDLEFNFAEFFQLFIEQR
ncbi:HD domain-containing phosphohydrolase [Amphritea balenae]|uniref:HD-GYP domain-containing protein n=1 Tax=Amphritea balenae TaxID=452629 RepID=A0A3P1SJR4_9GAMM|nr:HD domain-containing phosphohydrolase [Amphritea balenae]RRC97210.1 hypothetical protein EHS89_18545 [Amphritea balenae]GGK64210.1 two-component system response regulator [Amphritea balenae]